MVEVKEDEGRGERKENDMEPEGIDRRKKDTRRMRNGGLGRRKSMKKDHKEVNK